MNLDATSASPAGATGGGTFLTPAASYGFNATPGSVSGPPPPTHKSLARYVADLQRSLKDALEPARAEPTTAGTAQDKQYQLATQYYHDPALLHPLAVSTGSHPTAPGISTLQLPWELLTSALSSFEYQILNAGLNTNVNDPTRLISPASSVSDKDRIRLLALMRETGALTLADLATEEGTQRSKRLLDRRKDYKLGFPGNFIGKKNVKEMLESIAKDAGWETFQGADEASADGMDGSGMQTDDTPGAASASQTITMAGKGVVLDVDFVIPKKSDTTVKFLEESDESSFGTVTAVRFSYGAEGSTDPGVDKLLSRQAKAADWPAMRESLLTLARLDDVISLQESMSRDENAEGEGNAAESASASDLDPFSAMKMLTMQVEGIFKSELEVAGDASHLFTTGHGVAIPYHSSPYLNLIYHASSYALQTEEWDQIIQSGFQSEKLAELTKLEDGVLTMRFVVQKTNEPLPFNLAFPQALTGIEMVSKATFPLLPSAPTGLTEKITSGLHFIAKLNKPIVISAAAGRRLQDILLGSSVAATFPAIQMQLFQMPNQQANLSMEVTLERVLLADRDAGVVYDLEMTNMQSCPSIRAKLQPDAYAPAFKIDQFAFETVDQLMAAVEVLRMQAYFNDLLQNLFEGAKVGKPERDIEAGITLEALLSDDPLSSIDLLVQTDSDASWPPALNLSFLLPHLPSWLPVKANIRICPSVSTASGCEVLCNFSCAVTSIGKNSEGKSNAVLERISSIVFGDSQENEKLGREKMQTVLALSRDPKMVIRWISYRIQKATVVHSSLSETASIWRQALES